MYIIVLHKVVVTFAITLVVTALITVVLTRLCYKNWLELKQKEAKLDLFIIALQYNMTYTYSKRLMTVTNVNNCCIDGGKQSILCNYYQ